jgi:outer membrane usher protein
LTSSACRRSTAFVVLLLLVLCCRLNAQGKVLLKLIVNTEDRGDYYLELTDDGDILITNAQLREIGFTAGGGLAGASTLQVSLRSLSPGITFKLMEDQAAVAMTVDPALMGTQVKDLALARRSDVLYPETNSLFLNYTLDYVGEQNLLTLPLELAARIGPFLLLTDGQGHLGQSRSFTRNLTSLVFDSRTDLVRGIVGDYTATSSGLGLGSSGLLGGVSLSRNFDIDPFFLKRPSASLTALLPSPASVQMYMNGTPSGGENRFSSGRIQLVNLPLPPGANTVSLQMTDAAGMISRLTDLFYVGTNLLAPGVHEYSYNAGFTREDLGIESFAYADPVVLGFHRVGITDWLTLGARGEASSAAVNGGPLAAVTLGVLGELNASLSVSDSGNSVGYGAAAMYAYQGRPFGVSASIRYVTDNYATVAVPAGPGASSLIASLSFSYSDGLIGSLSASASLDHASDAINREVFTLSYSRQLWGNVQLQALLEGQVDAGGVQVSGFVGTRVLLGDALASLTYSSDDGLNGVTAGVEKNVTRGNGFGYRAALEEAQRDTSVGPASFSGDGRLDYHGTYGDVAASVGYDQTQNRTTYELTGAGSLVAIDGTLHLAQPIADSFALVRVDSLKGVRIKYGTQYIGVTDTSGTALITGLASYSENQVGIEQADVPMDHTIEKASAYISPPYRGGGVVDFKAVKFKALSGRLFFLENGQRAPAEYAGLDVTVRGETVSSVVGLGGAFYLENIPAGTYDARLYTEDKEARFQLVVPDSAQTVVDAGEIECPVQVKENTAPQH